MSQDPGQSNPWDMTGEDAIVANDNENDEEDRDPRGHFADRVFKESEPDLMKQR